MDSRISGKERFINDGRAGSPFELNLFVCQICLESLREELGASLLRMWFLKFRVESRFTSCYR